MKRLLAALVLCVLLVFVAVPLLEVLRGCLTDREGSFTLEHLGLLFSRRHFVLPIRNSLLLGVLVASFGTLIGGLFAFAVARTGLPFRGLLKKVSTLPIITPSFVIALSAILLFGRNGVVTRKFLLEGLGINVFRLGFDVYGLWGLVAVETLAYFPSAYLLLLGVLQAIDPALEEAARSLGANRLSTFFRVTLPLAAPGIFAALLLIFIESLADFGNPLAIGGRFNVLSVQAYLQITGNDDVGGGTALALALLVPSVLVYFFQNALLERSSFVTVGGKAARSGGFELGPGGRFLVGGATLAVSAVVLALYGFLFYGSLVQTWGADPSLTLEHYVLALQLSRRDVIDSVLLAAIAAPLATGFSLLIAYLLERQKIAGRRAIELLCLLSLAVPGTVVGIGYALAFSKAPLILTGTATIIVALDRSLEEAAMNLGASPGRAFVRVTLPVLAPSVMSSLVFGFVRAMTSVSAVIFVVSGSWNLLTVAILGFVDSSNLAQGAALAVILVAVVLVAFEGMRALLKRSFPGRFSEVL
jgi:iron(III) transport system permease protein